MWYVVNWLNTPGVGLSDALTLRDQKLNETGREIGPFHHTKLSQNIFSCKKDKKCGHMSNTGSFLAVPGESLRQLYTYQSDWLSQYTFYFLTLKSHHGDIFDLNFWPTFLTSIFHLNFWPQFLTSIFGPNFWQRPQQIWWQFLITLLSIENNIINPI